MTTPYPYTIWDATTGEIVERGINMNPVAGEGQVLYLGTECDPETTIFDKVTGDPIARSTARLLSQDDLHVEVNRERVRRTEIGKVIDGIYVTGRDEDIRNLTNLALGAQFRLAVGDNATETVFRDGNNVDHPLIPTQVIALWQQSATYVSALYAASWEIKALDPIPQDITDDAHWPS